MPVAYMEENRVFDIDGKAYAVYVLDPQPYAFQPKRMKHQVIDRFIRGVSSLTGEFYIYLLTKQWSIPQVLNEMKRFGNHPGWAQHMKETENHLVQFLPFTRLNFLVIPLNRKRITVELTSENWKEWITLASSSVTQGLLDVKQKFFRGDTQFPTDVLDAVKRESDEYLIKLRPFGRVKKASLRQVEWWLKKGYYRGLPDPFGQIPDPFPAQVITRGGKEVLRPIRTSVLTLSDVIVDDKMTRLVIHHEEKQDSHQTFFSTVSVPEPIPSEDPSGREWLYGILESTYFPVDAALHIRVEPPQEALQHLGRKKRTAEAQWKEWAENDQDVPLELEENMVTVPVLEKKLRARNPLLHVKTVFALGASNQEELKQITTDFASIAGEYHVLVKSPGDMRKMFQAFYPFANEELPTAWEIPMDPGILGAAVPFGTRMLGDPIGFWLGSLATGRPVFMNPQRPIKELNTTAAILLCGKLGSGKSYTMKLIVYMLLLWGAVGFAIDPKGEYHGFLEIPDLGHEVKLVEFTDGSDTQFTPFRLASTQGESSQAAFGILELIFNPAGDEKRNIVIGTAIEQVYKRTKWDMHAFRKAIEDIQEHSPEPTYRDEAKIVAHRLQLLEQHSLGRLLFGEDEGERLFDKRFFVAIVRGLTLPARGTPKGQWTDGERLSAAMLYAVATLGLKQLLKLPKSQLKFLALDEVWVLREFDQGRKLYNEALRLSRSENLIPIMASQNATDYEAREGEEDITGLFGWKFFYRLDSLTQVAAALRILGMTDEDPKDWLNTFAEEYQEGFGIVKDPEGRIGEMQVDLIDESLHPYFSSTPA